MRRTPGADVGYTIVEVMIVMAVTAVLFVSVVAVFGGQQNRTQFSQAINDIDSRIRDVIGNVSNGYYVKGHDFACDANGDVGPHITTGSSQLGESTPCIFIGRAMQFAVDNDQAKYNIYDIVGQRTKNGQEVTSFADAYPTAIGPNLPPALDNTERGGLLYGLTAIRMYFKDSAVTGGHPVDINTVAFLSSLPGYTAGNLNPGNSSVLLMPIYVHSAPFPNIQNNVPGNTQQQGAMSINKDTVGIPPAARPPDDGVTICFQSGGTDKIGVITIGSNDRQLTTKVTIENQAVALATGGDCDPLY